MADERCQKFRVGQTVRHRVYDIELGPMEVLGYDDDGLVLVRGENQQVWHRHEDNLRHDPHGEAPC